MHRPVGMATEGPRTAGRPAGVMCQSAGLKSPGADYYDGPMKTAMRGAIPAGEQSVTDIGATAVSPRAGASRLAWTVGDRAVIEWDQLCSRNRDRTDGVAKKYRVFTLVYATYQIALGIARALVSEPLVVRFSLDDLMHKKDPVKSATGASLLIGAALGGLIVVVSLLFSGDTRLAFVVLGVGLPPLLLQDCWRFVFFAAGLPSERPSTTPYGLWRSSH